MFCLEISEHGQYCLKRKHAYFHQIQLQMKLCEVNYGDFIIWREAMNLLFLESRKMKYF